MSRFFSNRHNGLTAYVPGEQPKDLPYIKLNTNESPYPPSPGVLSAVAGEATKLMLYSDPTAQALNEAVADVLSVSADCLLMTNGSDEILNFAFMAFGDEAHPFIMPDITYGFYPVFARLNRIPFEEIPLRQDFSVDVDALIRARGNIIIANPNAPTGMVLPLSEIERIVASDRDRIVVVDEAYIDFGGDSAIGLIGRYDNLLVTRTFSKSYSLAGGRLGFGVACPALIRDLNTIKYSINPYNVNRMTMAAGVAAMRENAYYMENCRRIMATRAYTAEKLGERGFSVLPSETNFLFARHHSVSGSRIYTGLRERGILVRHFSHPRIVDYNRITVGTAEQMNALLAGLDDILQEEAR